MIGAGNVSTHISRHLHLKGHRISCVYSRSEESAMTLANELECLGTAVPDEVPDQADFYIVSVPDSAVSSVAGKFTGRKGTWLHTAGALAMDVFKEHYSRYGVLYPLQTLSRTRVLNLEQSPFLVEGSSLEVSETIIRLAGSISTDVQKADSHTRRIVHLAAVFANNFSNHMVHIGQQILSEQELDPKLLDPIIKETFRKILDRGAMEAQTGPALRNDRETMQKHAELLKQHPEWEKLYTFISRDIGRARDK
ncbi:MAG: Rossmann-like and DUF2520 domain-containing protein [Bacteroidota bacterium]